MQVENRLVHPLDLLATLTDGMLAVLSEHCRDEFTQRFVALIEFTLMLLNKTKHILQRVGHLRLDTFPLFDSARHFGLGSDRKQRVVEEREDALQSRARELSLRL